MNETIVNTGGIDIAYLRQWIQHNPVIVTDTLDLRPARGLAAMLDQNQPPQIGDILPPLWQWVYFTPFPLASEIGSDGHPARGGFLPPVTLPRRMWAASTVWFKRPLHLGETVQKQSCITDVKLKQGTAGPLVFVTVDHKYLVEKELCISEEQTLVYIGAPPRTQPVSKGEEHTEPCDWSRRVEPDPVMLFRYSALTGNTHRIHFDRVYASREESYPGLIVHAPLTATLLVELLREHYPETPVSQFSFRAVRPLPDTAPFIISGNRKGNAVFLRAIDANGELAVNATALFSSK